MEHLPAEIVGESAEEYTRCSVKSWHRFLVPWTKRREFVESVFARQTSEGASKSIVGGGLPPGHAVTIRFRESNPAGRPGTRSGEKTLPPRTLVEAEVEYWVDLGHPPTPVYALRPSLILRPLVTTGGTWCGASAPDPLWGAGVGSFLPGFFPSERLLPTSQWLLTLMSPAEPPWEILARLRGKVNAEEFLGFPPETLLLVEMAATHMPPGGREVGFLWELCFRFLERWHEESGETLGWNHQRSAQTGMWERAAADGRPLYSLADFALILDLAW